MIVVRSPVHFNWYFIIIFRIVMVLNATFNNISVLLWRSVLLVEETGILDKTTDLQQVIDSLYRIMMDRVHLAWTVFELTTLVVIGTNYIGSCKSNYHAITTTTVPLLLLLLSFRKRSHFNIQYCENTFIR